MIIILKLYQNEWRVFQKEYRKIFYYLCWFTFAVFLVSFIGSYLFFPEESATRFTERQQAITNSGFREKPAFDRFLSLTSHNMYMEMKTVSFGLVPVLILPVLVIVNTIGNLGTIYTASLMQGDSLLFLTFVRVAPHAIVETLAMIMAATLGIWLSWKILNSRESFLTKAIWGRIFRNTCQLTRSFLLLVAPLVIISGFLEGFVTPTLIRWFTG